MNGHREDPVGAYNFRVSLLEAGGSLAGASAAVLPSVGSTAVAGFSECTGLEGSLDIEEYAEGGNPSALLRFPTRVKWTHLVLKRGLAAGPELWDWFFGFVEGRGTRRDGLITLLNEQRETHTVWGFRNGLPAKYSGPAMNAAQSAVAIESIEIAHEGLYRV